MADAPAPAPAPAPRAASAAAILLKTASPGGASLASSVATLDATLQAVTAVRLETPAGGGHGGGGRGRADERAALGAPDPLRGQCRRRWRRTAAAARRADACAARRTCGRRRCWGWVARRTPLPTTPTCAELVPRESGRRAARSGARAAERARRARHAQAVARTQAATATARTRRRLSAVVASVRWERTAIAWAARCVRRWTPRAVRCSVGRPACGRRRQRGAC